MAVKRVLITRGLAIADAVCSLRCSHIGAHDVTNFTSRAS